MKKNLLLLSLFFLLFTYVGQAQFRVDIVAGANVSGFSGGFTYEEANEQPFLPSYGKKLGFHAGIELNTPLADRISFASQFLFNVKGARVLDGIGQPKQIDLHYISVPLFLQFRILQIPLFLNAGTEVSYLIDYQPKLYQFIDDQLDIGIHYGLFFRVGEMIGIEFNLTHGLPILSEATYTDENGQPLGSEQLRNQNMRLSLKYIL